MNNLKTVFCCIGMVLSQFSFSQELPPVGSLPMIYNGGFAGEGNNGRIHSGVKLQNFLFKRYNVFASYDQFISPISTGVGITALYSFDKYTDGSIIILSASPKISFKGKYTLAPFVDAIFAGSRFTFGKRDHISESSNIRAGFLFNGNNFYFGYSAYLLNLKNNIDISDDFNSIFQAGYSFQKLPDSRFSFTPQIVFAFRNSKIPYFRISDYSLIARYKKLLTGINSEGLAIGYQSDKFKILMSQNFILAWDEDLVNTIYSSYGCTIGMRYLFNTKRKTPFN